MSTNIKSHKRFSYVNSCELFHSGLIFFVFSLEQRREKRATTSTLYLDTLNITMLRKHNMLLLRAAVWEIQDEGALTLVEKHSLPNLPDSNGVTFITTEKKCDLLLKDQGIKCPAGNSKGKASGRSSPPLENPKVQGVVGASAAILLIIIVIFSVCCVRRRRKHNKEV